MRKWLYTKHTISNNPITIPDAEPVDKLIMRIESAGWTLFSFNPMESGCCHLLFYKDE